MSARGTDRRPTGGFTLLELLVSVTIVSLLASGMLFSWRVAASAWGRSNAVLDEQRRVTSTIDLLNKQMTEMVPAAPWVGTGNPALFFQGDPDTARFLSRYSLGGRAGAGPCLIEYHVSDVGDGTQLLLMNEVPEQTADQAGPLLSGMRQSPDGSILLFAPFERRAETLVLLRGVKHISLEYYHASEGQQAGEWVGSWISRANELPRGMAIRVSTNTPHEWFEPLAVVAEIPDFSKRTR